MADNIADNPINGSYNPENSEENDFIKSAMGKKKGKAESAARSSFPIDPEFYKGKDIKTVLSDLKTTLPVFKKSKAWKVFNTVNTNKPSGVSSSGDDSVSVLSKPGSIFIFAPLLAVKFNDGKMMEFSITRLSAKPEIALLPETYKGHVPLVFWSDATSFAVNSEESFISEKEGYHEVAKIVKPAAKLTELKVELVPLGKDHLVGGHKNKDFKPEDKGTWADKVEEDQSKTSPPQDAVKVETDKTEKLQPDEVAVQLAPKSDPIVVKEKDVGFALTSDMIKRISLKKPAKEKEHLELWTKIIDHIGKGGKLFVQCIRDIIPDKFWTENKSAAKSVIFRGNSKIDFSKFHEDGVVHFGYIANPVEINRMINNGWMIVAQATNVKHVKTVIHSNLDKQALALGDLAQIQRLYEQHKIISGFINMPCDALKRVLDGLPTPKDRPQDVEKRKKQSTGPGSDFPPLKREEEEKTKM